MPPELFQTLLRLLAGAHQAAHAPAGLPWPPPPTMMVPPFFQPPPPGHVPVAPSYPMGFPYFTPHRPLPPHARQTTG